MKTKKENKMPRILRVIQNTGKSDYDKKRPVKIRVKVGGGAGFSGFYLTVNQAYQLADDLQKVADNVMMKEIDCG